MNVNVNTPLQSCEDCKWFSLDVDEAYMDGMPYPLWRCRYHAICENAIDLYKKEKGNKNDDGRRSGENGSETDAVLGLYL